MIGGMMSSINPMYIKGTLRLMLYEHWQRLGISNTYQLKPDWSLHIPRSIDALIGAIEDAYGDAVLHNWQLDITDDFNGGHRA
jgi:hypothetical protein